MRAVLDPNVLISSLLSGRGAPARIVQAWQAGAFELVVSDALLGELARALAYPKLRRLVPAEDTDQFVELLMRTATSMDDPSGSPPVRSADPADDYLLALAANADAILVSGDAHLLALAATAPVRSTADFLATLEEQP